MHNPAPVLENNTHKLLWDFDIHTDHLISARRPALVINNKKRTCKIVDFAEKKDKYLDLARELKKLWNMQVTIILIVIGAFGTVTKGLLKGLEDLEVGRPSKLQHYWERPEYWEKSWRLEETCCHSNSSERPSANADVKNSKRDKNNDNNDSSRGKNTKMFLPVCYSNVVTKIYTKKIQRRLEIYKVAGKDKSPHLNEWI